MRNLYKLYNLLTVSNKLKFLFIILISIISSVVELFSVVIIIPIIQIITNQKISTNRFFDTLQKFITENLNLDKNVAFFSIFIFITLFTSLLRFFVLKKGTYFSYEIGSFFSTILFSKIIKKSYDSYLNTDSSEILVDITLRVDKLIGNVLLPVLNIITSVSIIIFLFGYLLIKFTYPTICIILFSFVLIFIIKTLTSKKLNTEREIANTYTNKTVSMLQDVIGLYREIIIKNYFENVEKEFEQIDAKLRKSQATCQLEPNLSKFTVEPILLIFILGLALYLNTTESYLSLTFLGVFLFAAQKIIPQINVVFSSYINMKVSAPIIKSFLKTITENQENLDHLNSSKKDFEKIIFSNVSFNYSNSAPLFTNLNLEISKGDKIVICGNSGSGKSTFINLLLGFLIPHSGEIYFSSKNEINNDVRVLRKNLSLMPQSVYLKNDTILKNIILYSPLDLQLVEDVIDKVQLRDFINSQKNGLYSNIGENGITISGGQRQRIALARALYAGSDILILDEATSALDSKSSEDLVDTICKLKYITIIFITHNRNLFNQFNKIIEVKHGVVDYIKQ
jgi:ATP-binding cassette, subfamily B, bacterial PglK